MSKLTTFAFAVALPEVLVLIFFQLADHRVLPRRKLAAAMLPEFKQLFESSGTHIGLEHDQRHVNEDLEHTCAVELSQAMGTLKRSMNNTTAAAKKEKKK